MDEDGFHNSVGAKEQDIDILLMGSSQMFAVQVSTEQSTGERLNAMLPEMHTYNIGMAEQLFHTCVGNIASAVAQYHPAKYVILETDSVALSMEDMQNVLSGGYAELDSQDQGILYVLQRYVPVTKVFYRHLTSWLSAAPAAPMGEDGDASAEYHNVMNAYFAKAVEPVAASGARLIIFYHPSTEIDAEGHLVFNTDPDAMADFREGCERYGITFVDMTDAFARLYQEEHRLPYGFANTQVGKGHFNVDGHRLVAEELCATIQGLEEKEE